MFHCTALRCTVQTRLCASSTQRFHNKYLLPFHLNYQIRSQQHILYVHNMFSTCLFNGSYNRCKPFKILHKQTLNHITSLQFAKRVSVSIQIAGLDTVSLITMDMDIIFMKIPHSSNLLSVLVINHTPTSVQFPKHIPPWQQITDSVYVL